MEMKRLKTRFTKVAKAPNVIKRQAFLDALYDEAYEDPYRFTSITAAVDHLSQKFGLSLDEILYLKKKAKQDSGISEKK
jgi:hypothetical protein